MACIHRIVGILKKKGKKENCSNISQPLGSFKIPTTDTSTHVLTHENVDVHTLKYKSVHSYTLPVLIMLRVQTMVCPWLTTYKVALRCTLLIFLIFQPTLCICVIQAFIILTSVHPMLLFPLLWHAIGSAHTATLGTTSTCHCYPPQSNQAWPKGSPCSKGWPAESTMPVICQLNRPTLQHQL